MKIKDSDRCGDDYEDIGLERFLLETENAEATMTCYFSLIDGDSGVCLQETMGKRTGKIVKPQGTNGFGWDALFCPEKSIKTFAQMTIGEKNWHSPRFIAANKLNLKF